MRKAILMAAGAIIILFQGCAVNGPGTGMLFSSYQGPVAVTPYPVTETAKVGEGTASCILGLFSIGDASIHSAAAKAGITKIQHVDYKFMNVLFGIYSEYKIIVYGE
jgi:hypothetical protein